MASFAALLSRDDTQTVTEAGLVAGPIKVGKTTSYVVAGNGEFHFFPSGKTTFQLKGMWDVPVENRVDFLLCPFDDEENTSIKEMFASSTEEKAAWLTTGTLLELQDHPKFDQFAFSKVQSEDLQLAGEQKKWAGFWGDRFYVMRAGSTTLEVYEKKGGKREQEFNVLGIYNVPGARSKRANRVDLSVRAKGDDDASPSILELNFPSYDDKISVR